MVNYIALVLLYVGAVANLGALLARAPAPFEWLQWSTSTLAFTIIAASAVVTFRARARLATDQPLRSLALAIPLVAVTATSMVRVFTR
jgi:hypothetical protein